MKQTLALLIPVLLLVAAMPVQGESAGQELTGSIEFTDESHFHALLNMSIYYANIDGKNTSADEIRDLLLSGDQDTKEALESMGREVFEDILGSFNASGNSSITIIAGDSGPVVVGIDGRGALSHSNCEAEIYRLLGDSGAEFSFTMKGTGIRTEIDIIAPDGFTIDGMDPYKWDGSACDIHVSSGAESGMNLMDVLIDIYRIDTSGQNQRIYANISLSADAYWIYYPGEVPLNRSIKLEKAKIPLIYALMDCGYIPETLWNSSVEAVIREAKEMMMAEFPNITFTYDGWKEMEDRVELGINASVSMPVSYMLRAGAFLRKVLTQNMNLNLYGTRGFITNYTVLIPEEMILGRVYLSPYAPNHHIARGERQGIFVSIDDGRTYSMNMEIGILVDFDPLIPLIAVLIITFAAWFILIHLIPAKRRRR